MNTYKKIQTPDEIEKIANVAYEIWSNHFKSMFNEKTLKRIIKCAQSKEAIEKHINDNFNYYSILKNNNIIGYFAYKIVKEKNELFLSKIYIYSDYRGKGIGKEVLKFLEQVCHNLNLKKLSLTVFHKNTNSIKTYEKWGFEKKGLIKNTFGKKLVFNDYLMIKENFKNYEH